MLTAIQFIAVRNLISPDKETNIAMWLSRRGKPMSTDAIGSKHIPMVIAHFIPGTHVTQSVLRRLIGSTVREQLTAQGKTKQDIDTM
jgi:hypothetical protein